MIIEYRAVGPFQMNTYVIGCAETRKAAVIDAGDEVSTIMSLAEKHALSIEKILQTHAHIDHVSALVELKERTQAAIYVSQSELPVYRSAHIQARMFGVSGAELPEPDHFIDDGDELQIGELRAVVLATPGHTPGGLCFWFEQQKVLFVGDTLFAGSIGRTDLPGGSYQTIMRSLSRLAELDADTTVYCGHGPATTIGREKRFNPFLVKL